MGSALRARSLGQLLAEASLKALTYALHRQAGLALHEWFQHSSLNSKPARTQE
jgi:hypothetical protein